MKKIAVCLLIISLFLTVLPTAGAELVVDRVLCQTLPGNGSVDLPSVGQDYSAFSCRASIDGIHVESWALVDGSGVPCTGMIENKPYTLYINVATNDPNYVFTLDSRAFVNNEASSLTIADDWHYATITRQIKPHYLAPTVWHNPTDEAHNRGELFAFLASAQPGYTSFEWYLRSPDNREIRAENITEIYPEVRVSIEDLGKGTGVRCNFNTGCCIRNAHTGSHPRTYTDACAYSHAHTLTHAGSYTGADPGARGRTAGGHLYYTGGLGFELVLR